METLARFTAELYEFISIRRCNKNLPDDKRNFVKNTGKNLFRNIKREITADGQQ